MKLLPWVVLTVAVVCLAMRFTIPHGSIYHARNHLFPTHLRIDSLMFGVVIAYCYHYHVEFWNNISKRWTLLLPIAFVLLLPALKFRQDQTFSWTIGFTLYYIAFGAILMACVGPQSVASSWPIWNWNPVRQIAKVGFYSYTIYLWHNDFVKHGLIWLFKQQFFASWPDTLVWLTAHALYVGMAVAVGILMSKLVEGPLLTLRDKLFPASTPQVQHASPERLGALSPTT